MAAKDLEKLLTALKRRFEANPDRHEAIAWAAVQARLERPMPPH